ncbi:ABC transporter permease [Streptomyces sp. NBC_01433]|uniref:ABC transporter permease n=1 Tax=Streptomyces sp. NBC_01433 TaxID=2903864 RepID=UPI0022593ADB|nr:ABC transporter permease [Streptomyces sp. NBC_01433]MCX4674512.1 ABC transporter permease [Streptomyces sp. NBC_01433]
MTTVSTVPVGSTTDSGPRSRFADLLAAEWIKTWSLRSTPWTYLITALVVVAFNAGTAYDHYKYWYEYDEGGRTDFVANGMPLLDAFTTNAGMLLALAAGAIGAVSVTGEYGSGLIRTTFTAVPARRSVMAAKVIVLTAVMTVFGAAVAGGSFWLTQAILSGRDAGVSLGHPGALRVVVASALLAPVSALVGLALGTLLRHGAGSVAGSVGVLLLLPMVVSDRRYVTAVVDHTLPVSAWTQLTDMRNLPVPFPWTNTGAWAVYAVWALAAAAVAVTAVQRRDQ